MRIKVSIEEGKVKEKWSCENREGKGNFIA
jgi:hypothetical protein